MVDDKNMCTEIMVCTVKASSADHPKMVGEVDKYSMIE